MQTFFFNRYSTDPRTFGLVSSGRFVIRYKPTFVSPPILKVYWGEMGKMRKLVLTLDSGWKSVTVNTEERLS